MKTKKGQFTISGLYHALIVKLISKKKMIKLDGPDTMGLYEHVEARIHLVNDLTPEVKRHTLFHEIAHHILDTLKDVKSEETKCDLLGAYLMKLSDESKKIDEELAK